MKKKTEIAILVLLSVNLIFSAVLGISFYGRHSENQNDAKSQYVMYVGTNDKDNNEQMFTVEEAKKIIDKICYKYLEGYTIENAIGSWADENGKSNHENTIVCIFDDAPKEKVYAIADEILEVFNQNTILIERDLISIDFYSGKE